MNTIDMNDIKQAYCETIEALTEQYGDYWKIPRDLVFVENEVLRAHYCIQSQPAVSIQETFRHYGIDRRVWERFNIEDSGGIERRERRNDKYQNIINWCEDNVGSEVTPNFLMDVGGMSYPTILKFIGDRPDLFRKIRRGVYEVRDVRAEREAEKV